MMEMFYIYKYSSFFLEIGRVLQENNRLVYQIFTLKNTLAYSFKVNELLHKMVDFVEKVLLSKH